MITEAMYKENIMQHNLAKSEKAERQRRRAESISQYHEILRRATNYGKSN